jgi:hypothetical protein
MMGIIRIILIIISALAILFNGVADDDNYTKRFIINGIWLLFLIYLLFN